MTSIKDINVTPATLSEATDSITQLLEFIGQMQAAHAATLETSIQDLERQILRLAGQAKRELQ